jgi:hypothetical protein
VTRGTQSANDPARLSLAAFVPESNGTV